jgi:hypothetical protein
VAVKVWPDLPRAGASATVAALLPAPTFLI